MKKLILDVTADDIAEGVPCDPCWCPLALASRRCRRLAFVVGLTFGAGMAVGWMDDKMIGQVPLPRAADAFAEAFDAGRRVKPRRFVVRVPDWWTVG